MSPGRVVYLTLALSAVANAGLIQKPDVTLPICSDFYKDAVKTIFLDTYGAYRQFAWGHDDLRPVSKGFSDGRNGWAATIVDSLSTMLVMDLGNDDLYQEALAYSSTIDFSTSKTSSTVSVFETTIRYLGGFLSAFELGQKLNGFNDNILIQKATEVANKMTYAWTNGHAIPYGFLDFSTNSPQVSNSNIAEAGTLALEWSTLSKHTSNATYGDLAVGALKHIAELTPPLPGLAAQGINPTTGGFVGAYVTWGGGSDSYFEYLLKYGRLSNTDDPTFINTWKLAVDTSIRFLISRSTVGDWTYLADYTSDKRIRHISSHLACFHGGNWITGGRLLDNQTIVDYGLQLVDACWNTYASTATGIGPEAFAWIAADGDYSGATPDADDIAFYNLHGFYLYPGAEYYYLRPEVLESNFIAWRATGDVKFYNRAALAVKAFQSNLKAPAGYAGIWNVNEKNGDMIDDTESFFYAEVLKYLYLTFDDPARISLDEWVFNTEAHPLIAPAPKDNYNPPTTTVNSFGIQSAFQLVTGDLPQVSSASILKTPLKNIIHGA